MRQTSLFDGPLYPRPPRQRESETSEAAAEAIRPKAGTLRALVLDYLMKCGDIGATDAEIQAHLEMDPSTQRPRRIELIAAGLVRDSGRKRKTPSGRDAVVWVAIQEATDGQTTERRGV